MGGCEPDHTPRRQPAERSRVGDWRTRPVVRDGRAPTPITLRLECQIFRPSEPIPPGARREERPCRSQDTSRGWGAVTWQERQVSCDSAGSSSDRPSCKLRRPRKSRGWRPQRPPPCRLLARTLWARRPRLSISRRQSLLQHTIPQGVLTSGSLSPPSQYEKAGRMSGLSIGSAILVGAAAGYLISPSAFIAACTAGLAPTRLR